MLFTKTTLLLLTGTFAINTTIMNTTEQPMTKDSYSISNFITDTHSNFSHLQDPEKSGQTIHFVLGNQSADLDSVASAIVYAYAKRNEGQYFPLINVSREDFLLRRDILYVLNLLNIDYNNLLFRDDIPLLEKLNKSNTVRITLVDHNLLAPDQMKLIPMVERIIDHHFDEQINYPNLLNDQKLIKTAGSNTSLIAQQLLMTNRRMTRDESFFLFMAILMDTDNLHDHLITTSEDKRVAEILKVQSAELYSPIHYVEAKRLFNSVDNFTPIQLLRKDFKLYSEGNVNYGIASMPLDVHWNMDNRDVWQKDLEAYQSKLGVDFLAVLGHQPHGHGRNLLIYIPDPAFRAVFNRHIDDTPELKRQLILLSSQQSGLYFYNLRDPLHRKQLQPLFKF